MTVAAPLTVTAAFDRVARWHGREEAVADSQSRHSFVELDIMSRQAAWLFARAGARPGHPVALLFPPSSIYVVAWLGAVRLGAIPTALHTRESGATLAAICRQIEPTLLVFDASAEDLAGEVIAGTPSLRASIRAHSALSAKPRRLGVFADMPADLAGADDDAQLHRAAEDDPVIISLSSGTTSLAKGVVHTHRSLIELCRTDQYLYGGVRPGDRSLVPLSTAFIGCLNGWLPFLNAGAASVFMEQFDLGALLPLVPRERISHLFLTPTLWRRLLDTVPDNADFQSLRLAGFAAEVMDRTTLERLRRRITPHVVQMYGSTETGAAATCIWADEMTGARLQSVGRPMLNVDMRIVAPGGGPVDEVGPGEIGEILVTSPSLASGIWKDTERTAASFIEADGRRWWRSKDLGRLDPEGFLTIEGRHDDMIISGGINIMPARVEDVLMVHPAVAEVAVIGLPDQAWGEVVTAYVVARGQPPSEEDMDHFAKASELSGYQRPRRYIFVDQLPRTPTNKINRRVLRQQAIAAMDPSGEP